MPMMAKASAHSAAGENRKTTKAAIPIPISAQLRTRTTCVSCLSELLIVFSPLPQERPRLIKVRTDRRQLVPVGYNRNPDFYVAGLCVLADQH